MESVQTEKKFHEAGVAAPRGGTTCVLKHGDIFGIYDRYGDIEETGVGEQGLYYKGTRYLSHFRLGVARSNPMLLNSTLEKDNSQLRVDLTTHDLVDSRGQVVVKGTVHIHRAKLLWNGVMHEHLRITHYGAQTVILPMTLHFGTDGADIFEVRGMQRLRRGRSLGNRCEENDLLMEYRGLDEVTRRTRIHFEGIIPELDAEEGVASFRIELTPGGQADAFLSIACETDETSPRLITFASAREAAEAAWNHHRRETASVVSTSERINDLMDRAAADLLMLSTATPHGTYPYAGVPWFSTPFGRDGIITALQNLWRDPATAKGVLAFLAEHQAQVDDPERDAEPGKILHERREGEMASLREIPYYAYYGSVDGTPLFLMLAGAYFRRTGDRACIERLWPNIEAALEWIDRYGDKDGDGFVEYERRRPDGILQQGWKDSDDSIFHADGSTAPAPIALCEVQGYVYAAKREIAAVALEFGRSGLARRLNEEAAELKVRFDTHFWCDEINTYALALDGNKQPCRVKSSNAGHALFTGIARNRRAAKVAQTLLSNESFSGWGVRTIATSEARYNPMSYHNGSIWPHDNAIIAVGLSRYGFKREAMRIISAIFDAGISMEPKRLPELFCGFDRKGAQHPTLYPVACSPQAWSSGAVFHLIQAALDMRFCASKPQLSFRQPMLPPNMRKLEINNLRVPDGCVDLTLRRHPRDVGFNVTRKEGDIEVGLMV